MKTGTSNPAMSTAAMEMYGVMEKIQEVSRETTESLWKYLAMSRYDWNTLGPRRDCM